MKLNILGGTSPHWKSPLVHLLTQRKVLDQLSGQQRLCLLNIVKVCLTKLKDRAQEEGDEFYQLEAADAWVVAASE